MRTTLRPSWRRCGVATDTPTCTQRGSRVAKSADRSAQTAENRTTISRDYAVVDSLRGASQAYGPRLLFGRRSVFFQWLKEDAPRKRSTVECPWPTAPLFCARKAFRESSGWAKAW